MPSPVTTITVTMASILDGTANTVMFSEWNKGQETTDANPGAVYKSTVNLNLTTNPSQPVIPAGSTSLHSILASLAAQCQSSNTLGAMNIKGFSWSAMGCAVGGGYSHITTPNKKSCAFSNMDSSTNNGMVYSLATMVGASSLHPGGVNVGFLDGSVRFIKDGVTHGVWGALATKAGGEILSSDSY